MCLQRFTQGGLIRCRALERVAQDMLAMAPDQAPGQSTADISARGLRTFLRLDSDGPTVHDGRAYFGPDAAPDLARAPNGAAAGVRTAAQLADGAAKDQPGSMACLLRPGTAAPAGGSGLHPGHGSLMSSARVPDASVDGGGSDPQAGAVAPAAERECDAGAGGDVDVELPIVTPFSHRLQDVLRRVAIAPVRPRWVLWKRGQVQKNQRCLKSCTELICQGCSAQCLLLSLDLWLVACPVEHGAHASVKCR